MATPSDDRSTDLLPGAWERLDSWKEIAAYLRRDVSTVQRWENKQGLPVHRLLHSQRASVYAYRSEIDNWMAERGPELERNGSPPRDHFWQDRKVVRALTLGAGLVLLIALGWWMNPHFPVPGEPPPSSVHKFRVTPPNGAPLSAVTPPAQADDLTGWPAHCLSG